MATLTWATLKIDEAAWLASLAGIETDLRTVGEMCSYYLPLGDFVETFPPREVIEAFCSAIVVHYWRPFAQGVRLRLGEQALASLSNEQRVHHDYLGDLRNKHIAHSVNEFEENYATAHYWDERAETEGVVSIGTQSGRMLGLSKLDIEKTLDLCGTLLAYVEEQMSNERERLLPIAREIPLSELLKNPPRAHGIKSREKVGERRRGR